MLKNRFPHISLLMLVITCLICLIGISYSQDSQPSENSDVLNIEADLNTIKWDEDIIRSWHASGNVSVEYIRGDKHFKCTSDTAFFERLNNEKPFHDSLRLTGNIKAELNGIDIETEEINLESNGDSYKISGGENTSLHSDAYTIDTGLFTLDADSGYAHFPYGAKFHFIIESEDKGEQVEPSQNLFGQCLRFDPTGGTFCAPLVDVEYDVTDNERFSPTRVSFPNGVTLTPRNVCDDMDSRIEFGKAEFDVTRPSLKASDGISVKNGPCELQSDFMDADWGKRILNLTGNVLLSRETIQFECPKVKITWDDEGRMSLHSENRPSMEIILKKNGKMPELEKE